MSREIKPGDRFLTKNMKIRVEEVKEDKVTYSIWPTSLNNPTQQKRMVIDPIETFNKRFPEERRKS